MNGSTLRSAGSGRYDERMRLPDSLREAISAETRAIPSAALTQAAREISERYRQDNPGVPLATTAHRLAYLAVRAPATFAACEHVLTSVCASLPDFAPESMLDLGAGPGTAAWAALEVFPSLRRITLLERDAQMLDIGTRLAFHAAHAALRDADWQRADLASSSDFGSYDLILASYSLGELAAPAASAVIRSAWEHAKVLVIIEPGTPRAFSRMVKLRDELIHAGAVIAVPCPHEEQCPLAAAGDWCHFSQRLERTTEHRRMKSGSLGYEDEKFSYLAATRLPVHRPLARIVRHPLKHPGYVQLQLCTAEGLKQETVTKSQKERYRAARKAEW